MTTNVTIRTNELLALGIGILTRGEVHTTPAAIWSASIRQNNWRDPPK